MKSTPCHSKKRSLTGFSLVEVVLAIGIMSFGLITVFALLPTGLVSVREGKMEEAASDILGLAATDLRATPANTNSALFGIDPYATNLSAVTNYLSAAGVQVAPEKADFRLVAAPRAVTNSTLHVWHLTVDWPPQANQPDNRTETLVFLRQ